MVIGEWHLDSSSNFKIATQIDVFDEDNKFLMSFVNNNISSRTIMKDDRIYSLPSDKNSNIVISKINLKSSEGNNVKN